MKYGVNRKVLLITAGIVWMAAGANILRIGIVTWLTDSQYWLFKIGEATVNHRRHHLHSSGGGVNRLLFLLTHQ